MTSIGTGYKLFRIRRDGTLGPLFVERTRVLPRLKWLKADMSQRPKGLAHRPGWHVLVSPDAPHLGRRGRAMHRVWYKGVIGEYERPKSQGGRWVLAKWIWIGGRHEE